MAAKTKASSKPLLNKKVIRSSYGDDIRRTVWPDGCTELHNCSSLTQVIAEALWHSWFDHPENDRKNQGAGPAVLVIEGRSLVDAASRYLFERSWADEADIAVVRRAMCELEEGGLVVEECPGRWLVSLERAFTADES
jgi:hypothetical protein